MIARLNFMRISSVAHRYGWRRRRKVLLQGLNGMRFIWLGNLCVLDFNYWFAVKFLFPYRTIEFLFYYIRA